jgi:tRNA(His) 5'-end guanylyltransferase
MIKDNLGDRIKAYEDTTCGIRMLPRIPVVCRLDGKNFSRFTKGLRRPYDERLSNLMVETTKYLVKETNANCGYTQSDEITLVWYSDSYESKIYFDGRLFKMISDLAAMASVFFNRELPKYLPEKTHLMPRFDCRVFNVPTIQEAANSFLWREIDCTKNSISMAAQHYYSHNELNGKNGSEKQEMLFQKGINWNDYPSYFKRGTYIQRKRQLTKFTTEELEKLPLKHKARLNPDLEIERWYIEKLDLPPLMTIRNREEVILFGAEPNASSHYGNTLLEMIDLYKKNDFDEFKKWCETILPLLKSPTN